MQVPTLGPRFHPRNRVGAAKPVPAEERTLDSLSGRCTIAVELAPTNLRCSTRCPCGHECRQENRGGTSLRCALQRRDEWAPKLPPVAVTPPDAHRQHVFDLAKFRDPLTHHCELVAGDRLHLAAMQAILQRQSSGMSGHVRPERPVTFKRNQWSRWRGIRTRFNLPRGTRARIPTVAARTLSPLVSRFLGQVRENGVGL